MDIDLLIREIDRGVVVLTQGKRLKRHLERAYDRRMRDEEGREGWPSPTILTYKVWIDKLYRESFPGKPLLTEARSKALWEKVVREHIPRNFEVLHISALSRESYSAYARLTEFTATLPESELYLTEESKALKRWIRSYEQAALRLGATSPFSVPELIEGLIRDKAVRLPERVFLAGFSELTPSFSMIVEALRASRVEVETFSPLLLNEALGEEPVVRLLPCLDMEGEVTALSRWARATLKRDDRLAVVAPELSKYSEVIEREFSSELYPSSVLPEFLTCASGKSLFDLSLATPLSNSPVAASALGILKLTLRQEDVTTLFQVLLSPYLHLNKTDYHMLSRANSVIREDNRASVSLMDVISAINQPGEGGPVISPSSSKGQLLKRLSKWLDLIKDEEKERRKPPSKWTSVFSALLKELSWPSPAISLSSAEIQALHAFRALLIDFAGLDEILGEVRWRVAAEWLTKMAADKQHQPEGPDAPLQALGLNETPGLCFDYVWLLGADDASLPGDVSPNPFLPIDLQREKRMPGASPELEEAYKKELLGGLIASTKKAFYVSYPLVSDGKERRAAPLITTALGSVSVEEVTEKERLACFNPPSSRIRDQIFTSAALEDMPEGKPIPVNDAERDGLRGLNGILKDQSACPFRAFAAHRLHASELGTRMAGVSPMEKGSFAHDALKNFWAETKDLSGLKALMESERLHTAVKKAVEEALKSSVKRNSRTHIFNIERDRLVGLIEEWLEVEATRGDFTVKELEERKEQTFNGVTFSLRVDRVDSLPDGREIIIDYKTGRCDTSDWNIDAPPGRPKDPQMPLYSRFGDYSGVTYGVLRAGECKFEGIVESEDILPKLKVFPGDKLGGKLKDGTNWPSLMESWSTAVNTLGSAFFSGVCDVDPAEAGGDSPTCKYCAFKLLCRVSESKGEVSLDDGEL